MSDTLIDLVVAREGRRVFGWVEHMDESLRGAGKIAASADGKFVLRSIAYPALVHNELHLPGTRCGCDNRVFGRVYDSPEEAIEAVVYIRECLDTLSEQRGGCVGVRTVGFTAERRILTVPSPQPSPPPEPKGPAGTLETPVLKRVDEEYIDDRGTWLCRSFVEHYFGVVPARVSLAVSCEPRSGAVGIVLWSMVADDEMAVCWEPLVGELPRMFVEDATRMTCFTGEHESDARLVAEMYNALRKWFVKHGFVSPDAIKGKDGRYSRDVVYVSLRVWPVE